MSNTIKLNNKKIINGKFKKKTLKYQHDKYIKKKNTLIKQGGKTDYAKIIKNIEMGAKGVAGLAAIGYGSHYAYKNSDKIKKYTEDKIIDSKPSNLISKWIYIFSPFGSKDSIINAQKQEQIELSKEDKNIEQILKERYKYTVDNFDYFYKTEKNLTYSNKSQSHLLNIQRCPQITQIYCISNQDYQAIESQDYKLFKRQFFDKKIDEIGTTLSKKKNDNLFVNGTTFWLILKDIYENYLFIPVVIKSHLFSKQGLYLDSTNETHFLKNINNKDNFIMTPTEFPFNNFLKYIPPEIKKETLLIPCFNSFMQIENLNFKMAEETIKKDENYDDEIIIKENEKQQNTHLSIEEISEKPKEFMEVSNIKQLINMNPEYDVIIDQLKNESKPPFFLEDLLNLYNSPLWINDYVINESFLYFKNICNPEKNYKNIVSEYGCLKIINHILGQKSINNQNQNFKNINIVPVVWTTSKKFINLGKIALATAAVAASISLYKSYNSNKLNNSHQFDNYVKYMKDDINNLSNQKRIPHQNNVNKESFFKKTFKKFFSNKRTKKKIIKK